MNDYFCPYMGCCAKIGLDLWPTVNKGPTWHWPGYFLTWPDKIFFDLQTKKIEKFGFGGGEFSWPRGGWSDLIQSKQQKHDPTQPRLLLGSVWRWWLGQIEHCWGKILAKTLAPTWMNDNNNNLVQERLIQCLSAINVFVRVPPKCLWSLHITINQACAYSFFTIQCLKIAGKAGDWTDNFRSWFSQRYLWPKIVLPRLHWVIFWQLLRWVSLLPVMKLIFQFFVLSGQKKSLRIGPKKYSGQSKVGPLFTAGQKYAWVESGPSMTSLPRRTFDNYLFVLIFWWIYRVLTWTLNPQ